MKQSLPRLVIAVRMARAATLGMTCFSQIAAAEDALDWKPMQLTDLHLPGSEARTYAGLWRDELVANNEHYALAGDLRFAVGNAPATEAHIVVRSRTNSKQVAVTILNTFKGCSVAASDSDGTTIKRCPAKLALFRGGEVEIIDVGPACYVEYSAKADTSRNAAVAAFDPESASIRLAVIFQGEITDACLVNIPLPKPQQQG